MDCAILGNATYVPGLMEQLSAPAVFIVTPRTDVPGMYKAFHMSDVAIAIIYGPIAAKHLGLATFMMGPAEIAFNADKRLRTEYSLPGNRRIDGIATVGYPGSDWTKIPPRGPANFVWLKHASHAAA